MTIRIRYVEGKIQIKNPHRYTWSHI